MLINFFRIGLLLSASGLVYQLFLIDRIKSGVMVALLGIVWLYGQNRRWHWISYPIFALFTILTGQLILLEASPQWALVIFTTLLCSWDLAHFIRRMNRKQEIRKRDEIEKRHLKRLLVMALLGLGVGELIFTTRFDIKLVWIAVLIITAALGLYFFLSTTRSNQ